MQLGRISGLLWRAANGLVGRNGLENSGYIAFTTMLALFPFLIFLVSITGFLGDTRTGEDFLTTLSLFAPPDVVNTLQPAIQQVIQNRSGSLLTFGLALALYSASSGISALRLALNLSYGAPETRPFWFCKLQDFLIVIVGSIVIAICSVAIILGPWVWKIIAWFTFIDPSDQRLWHIARYGFVLVILTLGVGALHRALPNTRLTIRQILPGALTTTIAWIVAASVLSIYFSRFGNYTATYGSLGGVIITLLFFYVSAIIFIFGGELNAALIAPAGISAPPTNMEYRPSPVHK
jgi:membrane protein